MALDPGPIAQIVAKFIDELEEDYGDEAELVTFCIVAELDLPDERNTVRVRGPEDVRISTRAGILARALEATLDPDGGYDDDE